MIQLHSAAGRIKTVLTHHYGYPRILPFSKLSLPVLNPPAYSSDLVSNRLISISHTSIIACYCLNLSALLHSFPLHSWLRIALVGLDLFPKFLFPRFIIDGSVQLVTSIISNSQHAFLVSSSLPMALRLFPTRLRQPESLSRK